jgi:hypothetical protein
MRNERRIEREKKELELREELRKKRIEKLKEKEQLLKSKITEGISTLQNGTKILFSPIPMTLQTAINYEQLLEKDGSCMSTELVITPDLIKSEIIPYTSGEIPLDEKLPVILTDSAGESDGSSLFPAHPPILSPCPAYTPSPGSESSKSFSSLTPRTPVSQSQITPSSCSPSSPFGTCTVYSPHSNNSISPSSYISSNTSPMVFAPMPYGYNVSLTKVIPCAPTSVPSFVNLISNVRDMELPKFSLSRDIPPTNNHNILALSPHTSSQSVLSTSQTSEDSKISQPKTVTAPKIKSHPQRSEDSKNLTTNAVDVDNNFDKRVEKLVDFLSVENQKKENDLMLRKSFFKSRSASPDLSHSTSPNVSPNPFMSYLRKNQQKLFNPVVDADPCMDCDGRCIPDSSLRTPVSPPLSLISLSPTMNNNFNTTTSPTFTYGSLSSSSSSSPSATLSPSSSWLLNPVCQVSPVPLSSPINTVISQESSSSSHRFHQQGMVPLFSTAIPDTIDIGILPSSTKTGSRKTCEVHFNNISTTGNETDKTENEEKNNCQNVVGFVDCELYPSPPSRPLNLVKKQIDEKYSKSGEVAFSFNPKIMLESEVNISTESKQPLSTHTPLHINHCELNGCETCGTSDLNRKKSDPSLRSSLSSSSQLNKGDSFRINGGHKKQFNHGRCVEEKDDNEGQNDGKEMVNKISKDK